MQAGDFMEHTAESSFLIIAFKLVNLSFVSNHPEGLFRGAYPERYALKNMAPSHNR
jgi:hypothetical protein